MTTDRPDITEVPFTINPGHFQIETTLYGFARSRPSTDGAIASSYELAGSNIRIGLTDNTEATVMVQPFGHNRAVGPAGSTHQRGAGALVARAKINLWGNDTFQAPGSTALALLPYVSLPIDRNNGVAPDYVDGGVLTFFAVKVGGGFSLGINAGIHSTRSGVAVGRHIESSGSMSLGYEWSEKLSTYVEVAGRFWTKDSLGDIGLAGGGISYKLTPNLQLDCGVNFGFTRASDRFAPFVGVSARF